MTYAASFSQGSEPTGGKTMRNWTKETVRCRERRKTARTEGDAPYILTGALGYVLSTASVRVETWSFS